MVDHLLLQLKTIKEYLPNHSDCLQCDGTGKIFLRPKKNPPHWIDCDICKGTGKAEHKLLWMIQGCKMREWRMKKELGLREASRKYKIDASNLSKMELGFIKPDSKYLKMVIDDLYL